MMPRLFLLLSALLALVSSLTTTSVTTTRTRTVSLEATKNDFSDSPSSSTRRNFFGSVIGGLATAALLSNNNAAWAYPRRDVGGADRSAATAAMNDQAYETNNRLERDGFQLDTPEQEQARLADAMASFSYSDSMSSGSKNNKKNKKTTTSSSTTAMK